MNIKPSLEHNYPKKLLNIAAYLPATTVLGPGKRAAVWVQGCEHHCRGCIVQEWWSLKPNILVEPHELVEKLNMRSIQGITISGGEPFLQAYGLVRLVQIARSHKPLDVICYTGFTYQELVQKQDQAIDLLLGEIDVLIDGTYKMALDDDKGLRGSSNQIVHHLTDKLCGYDFENKVRKTEIHIRNGEIFTVGIPDQRIKRALVRIGQETEAIKEIYIKG